MVVQISAKLRPDPETSSESGQEGQHGPRIYVSQGADVCLQQMQTAQFLSQVDLRAFVGQLASRQMLFAPWQAHFCVSFC